MDEKNRKKLRDLEWILVEEGERVDKEGKWKKKLENATEKMRMPSEKKIFIAF